MHSYMTISHMTINCTTVPRWLKDFAVMPIVTMAEPDDEVDAYQISLCYDRSNLQKLCAKLDAEPKVYEYYDPNIPGLWIIKPDNE